MANQTVFRFLQREQFREDAADEAELDGAGAAGEGGPTNRGKSGSGFPE